MTLVSDLYIWLKKVTKKLEYSKKWYSGLLMQSDLY